VSFAMRSRSLSDDRRAASREPAARESPLESSGPIRFSSLRGRSHAKMLKRIIKRWLEGGLRVRGYELRELGTPPRGYRACLEYAKSRGLSPRTVFDVGVGHGTPWLYDAFPDAKLVLFEPLAVFDGELTKLASRYNADVHRVALAEREGVAEGFNQNVSLPTSSSLFRLEPRFAQFVEKVHRRHEYMQLPVVLDTLDHLNAYDPPFMLKLDVEGAETRVLRGARETLRHTDFLITEISVMTRQRGEPEFAQVISFLDECGFQLFDIPSLSQSGHDGQLVYLDAAFVPKNSELWPS
jgi:FkbM family methyltransferase